MSVLATNAITDASGGNTATINSYTPTESNMAGRNWLINGAFTVSQRGDYSTATVVSNATYYLDRWIAVASVAGTIQRTTNMPTGTYGYSLKMAATASATAQFTSEQRIEVFEWMKGKTVIVSAMVRSNSALCSINMYNNIDGFGTPVNHAGDGTWQRITFTTTIPTGALTDLRVRVGISQSGNTTVVNGDYFEMAEVQLEAGSVATPFEHRLYGQELQLAQRYYWKFDLNGNIIASAMLRPDGVRIFQFQFRQTMRSAPTATYTYDADGSGGTLTTPSITADYFKAGVTATLVGSSDPRLTAFNVSAEL